MGNKYFSDGISLFRKRIERADLRVMTEKKNIKKSASGNIRTATQS